MSAINDTINDSDKMLGLASLNLSLGAVQHWLVNVEPIFRALVPIGQLVVAIVTIAYFLRKMRQGKEDRSERRETRTRNRKRKQNAK